MAWVHVAQVSEVPSGRAKAVTVDGTRVLLCNVNGAFHAVGDVCTHDNGPLGQGTLEGCAIECPRHGARFDVRTGQALCLPAILPVAVYDVKIEGSHILVNDTAKTQNSAKTQHHA